VREKERGAHNKKGQSVSGTAAVWESYSRAGESVKRILKLCGHEGLLAVQS